MGNGQYHILRKLGKGGEGEVYLVIHKSTEQLRAAKHISSSHPIGVRHELEVMKHLQHPGLPRILDVVEDAEQFWLIMEYVRGTNLQKWRGMFSPLFFFRIAGELTEVLEYLHDRATPILHLDIKPENIIIKADGHPVLVDFGASLVRKTDFSYAMMGTENYASPEQMQGRAVDARSDLYSLGVTLERFLSIRRRGKMPSGMWSVLTKRVLVRCKSIEPERRYSTAGELRKHLRWCEGCYRFEKQIGYLFCSIILLLLVLGFLFIGVRESVSSIGNPTEEEVGETETGEQVAELLEQAERVGFSKALELFRKAAMLDPHGEWFERIIKRITEDYRFDPEEERGLQSILFSGTLNDQGILLDELKTSESYGEYAYRLGMTYWYYYDNSGGKKAADSWFKEALKELDGDFESAYAKSVKIHANMSSYYEKLGRMDDTGNVITEYASHWNNLNELWKMEMQLSLTPYIQYQICMEMLDCVVMGIGQIQEAGISKQEIEERIQEIEKRLGEYSRAVDEDRVVIQAAKDAVLRGFADERGTGIGKKIKDE